MVLTSGHKKLTREILRALDNVPSKKLSSYLRDSPSKFLKRKKKNVSHTQKLQFFHNLSHFLPATLPSRKKWEFVELTTKTKNLLHFYISSILIHAQKSRKKFIYKQTITQHESEKNKKRESKHSNTQKKFIFMRTKHFFFRVKNTSSIHKEFLLSEARGRNDKNWKNRGSKIRRRTKTLLVNFLILWKKEKQENIGKFSEHQEEEKEKEISCVREK